MSTVAVLKCRVPDCHEYVQFPQVFTAKADPDAELLDVFMANLKKIALCPYHQQRYNWYASQGRVADFEAGRP